MKIKLKENITKIEFLKCTFGEDFDREKYIEEYNIEEIKTMIQSASINNKGFYEINISCSDGVVLPLEYSSECFQNIWQIVDNN